VWETVGAATVSSVTRNRTVCGPISLPLVRREAAAMICSGYCGAPARRYVVRVPAAPVPIPALRRGRALPAGVELYRLGADGAIALRTPDAERRLDRDPELLRFIDDGQRAHYLIGEPDSGPRRPSQATVKIGVVAPHTAFRPHVHGAEHVVLSLGYASCTLTDGGRLVELALTPGWLVRIPAMLPHAFGNRAGEPLLIVAANTGLGIADEDYAVVADEARRRAAGGDRFWADVAAELDVLAAAGPGRLRLRERAARRLRALAERLDGAGPG
jgi:hypothetical protein